jgi:hypothetical protein
MMMFDFAWAASSHCHDDHDHYNEECARKRNEIQEVTNEEKM